MRITLKISIALMLLWYLIRNSSKVISKFVEFTQFGIMFSLLGDIALIFIGFKTSFGVNKLIFFTLAASKLFYVLAFSVNFSEKNHFPKKPNKLFSLLISVPVLILGIVLSLSLTDNLGRYKILITLYIFLMTIMQVLAIMRLGYTPSTSFWTLVAGSFLIILANIIIGIQQIIGINANAIAVAGQMIYHISGFLIAYGVIKHVKIVELYEYHRKRD